MAKYPVSWVTGLYLDAGGMQGATLYQWSLSMSGLQLQELHHSF